MIDLASRISKVNPSLTLAVTAKAKAMKADGLDVCSFSAGEPDFDTPSHIKEAAKTALDEGKTKYGNTSGELALRQAIVDKLARQGLTYDVDNIIATNGGKHSLFDLMMALIEEGDEVIIPTPYWVSYPEMVTLAGGTSVLVRTTAEKDYKITPEQLIAAITPKTKLFVFNSPSNPTGTVYTREEITALAQVVVDHDILVVSDEIYEYILYDGAEHISMASISPEIYGRTLISNGFAKGYSMTGWRIGYIAGPKWIVKAMTSVQGHSTSNICTFAQYGAIAALEGSQNCVKKMLSAFTERRKYVLNRLKGIPNITCSTPMGAFYVFIDVSHYGLDSITFCDRLLNEQYVATIPGKGFGDDNCIRISYATSLGVIEKGLDRFEKFLASL